MPFFKIKRSFNFMRGRGKSGVGVVDKGADNYCSFMFMDDKVMFAQTWEMSFPIRVSKNYFQYLIK